MTEESVGVWLSKPYDPETDSPLEFCKCRSGKHMFPIEQMDTDAVWCCGGYVRVTVEVPRGASYNIGDRIIASGRAAIRWIPEADAPKALPKPPRRLRHAA